MLESFRAILDGEETPPPGSSAPSAE